MKIQYMVCPRCGGEIQAAAINRVNYCAYCGAPLYVEDNVVRSEKTMIIRDEARLKEAEIAARRLELEEERLRQNRIMYENTQKKENFEALASGATKIAGAAAFAVGSAIKILIAIIGILLIAVSGLFYLISPVDFLSGLIIDDIAIVYLCVLLISKIGHRTGR